MAPPWDTAEPGPDHTLGRRRAVALSAHTAAWLRLRNRGWARVGETFALALPWPNYDVK